MVSFNKIPANLRVPLFYAEFDNSNANQGGANQGYLALLIGQRKSTGTKAALTNHLITSAEQAQEYFGIGSMLADQAEAFLNNTKSIPLYCISLDDNVAGVKASGSIAFVGAPTKNGTISFMIGGKNIQISALTTDTAITLATKLIAAVNAETKALVTALVDGVDAFKVNLTYAHKGEVGNQMDIRHSYFFGEELPAGVTITIVAMNGGTANPDVDTAFAALGETQYILMSTPYVDASNLGKIETELDDRFGPLRGNDGYNITAKKESLSNLNVLGNSRNSQFNTILQAAGPSSPHQFAAAALAQIALSASIDPARPFQTLKLVGIYAPIESELLTLEERDILLHNGISTFFVDSGANVLLEGIITTYKKNAFNAPDESYLYLNVPLTLSYLRFDLKVTITSKYPRHKLANDGTRFDPGQAVVTPNVIKAEVVNKFREWEEKALVENFDQFMNDIIVERNSTNKNRLDILLPPDLVNQLVIVGTKIQFLL